MDGGFRHVLVCDRGASWLRPRLLDTVPVGLHRSGSVVSRAIIRCQHWGNFGVSAHIERLIGSN